MSLTPFFFIIILLDNEENPKAPLTLDVDEIQILNSFIIILLSTRSLTEGKIKGVLNTKKCSLSKLHTE